MDPSSLKGKGIPNRALAACSDHKPCVFVLYFQDQNFTLSLLLMESEVMCNFYKAALDPNEARAAAILGVGSWV